jgi:hypothetical protein
VKTTSAFCCKRTKKYLRHGPEAGRRSATIAKGDRVAAAGRDGKRAVKKATAQDGFGCFSESVAWRRRSALGEMPKPEW